MEIVGSNEQMACVGFIVSLFRRKDQRTEQRDESTCAPKRMQATVENSLGVTFLSDEVVLLVLEENVEGGE